MIIWLNGPFGIGKTSTAHALLRRVPAALLYDPEPFGAALRKTVATFEAAADFQELRAWPSLVVETARVLRDTYDRPLVLPLTVWRRSTVEVLLSGRRGIDPDVRPFRLVASEAVLRTRIMGRPDAEGPHAWRLAHLDAGLQSMGDAAFGEAIGTVCPWLHDNAIPASTAARSARRPWANPTSSGISARSASSSQRANAARWCQYNAAVGSAGTD